MNSVLLYRAVGLIDDDLIAESANVTRTLINRFVLKRIAYAAACIVLIIVLTPSILNLFSARTEDPNWYKTHSHAYSVDEAISKFGEDLLLDKLVLTVDHPVPYVEYILEHAEGGGVKDRQSWKHLTASVNYGGKRFSESEDHIDLDIFFNKDDPLLDGSDEYPGLRSVFKGDSKTTKINDVTVRYRELSTTKFKYAFVAEFNYNESIYFLQTYSKENEVLSWNTIIQMLDS